MAYADEVIADSPLAYLKLDDASGTSAVDSSGNLNHGTYLGNFELAKDDLKSGNYARFNCTPLGTVDGRVEINGLGNLCTGSFSLEVWCKSYLSYANTNAAIIGRGNNAGHNMGVFSFWPFVQHNNDFSLFRIRDNAGVSAIEVTSENNLFPGGWVHLVGTFNPSGNTVFYMNGIKYEEATTPVFTPDTEADPVYIGCTMSDVPNYYFRGPIAHAAIYNSELSATRVTAHWTAMDYSLLNDPKFNFHHFFQGRTVETYIPPARNHRLAGHVYVEGAPAKKRVYLFKRYSGGLITGTVSDAATGEWVIKGIADYGAKNLLALAFDDTETYNAEAADYLTQVDGDY